MLTLVVSRYLLKYFLGPSSRYLVPQAQDLRPITDIADSRHKMIFVSLVALVSLEQTWASLQQGWIVANFGVSLVRSFVQLAGFVPTNYLFNFNCILEVIPG